MTEQLLEEEALRAPAGNPRRFGGRWRLVSAGLSNVWRYGDLVMPAVSGRLLMRGPNGTGKTTALEALWPFLLDLDKTKLQAGKARTTTLTALMREGHHEKKRIGYVWLTFAGPGDEGLHSYGARLAFSNGSTPAVKVEPFTIPGEPVKDMPLVGPGRSPITTADAFSEAVEAAHGTVFGDDTEYLTALGNHVFGTDRSDLIALADRVRKVRNPSLLADTSAEKAAEALREALPGVSSEVIAATGEALAATDETRAAFDRDEDAAALLNEFATVWAGHAADVARRMADQANDARVALAKAGDHAASEAQRHQQAIAAEEAATSAVHARGDELSDATAAVNAIKNSPTYKTIGRLNDLKQTTEALAEEATARLDVLSTTTHGLSREAERLLGDARLLAKEVDAGSSEAVTVDPRASTVTISITTRPHSTLRVGDHAFDPGSTVDLPDDPEALTKVRENWVAFARSHEQRANSAELLSRDHAKVAKAIQDAQNRDHDASRAEESAEHAAQERERREASAAQSAAGVATEVASWAAANRDLTEDPHSDALDTATIEETTAHGPAALLAAADEWAQRAVHRAEALAADHESQAKHLLSLAAELDGNAAIARARAQSLRDGDLVLPPPRPSWATPADGRAFANALQWQDHVDETTRAHVESALAAAGILGATLNATSVQAEDWEVTPDSQPAARSLTELIDVEPTHRHAPTARRVLQAIAVAETENVAPLDTGTVIGLDGTFRVGVVSGRSPGTDDPAALPSPRHIGAAQRRAAALAEAERLDGEAEDLTAQAETHLANAEELRRTATRIRDRAREFPSTSELLRCERERASAAEAAKHLRATAERARAEANRLTNLAKEAARQWQEKATAMGLPPDLNKLAEIQRTASETARALRDVAHRLTGHHERLLRLRRQLENTRQDRDGLTQVYATASAAHKRAREKRLEYQKLETQHGQAAADTAAQLQQAERAVERLEKALSIARDQADQAGKASAAAEADARHAADQAKEREPAARETLTELRALVSVRDVAEIVLAQANALPGNELVDQVRERTAEVTTAGRRKVADTYEAVRARLAGVWAVDRTEGYGDLLDTYQFTFDGSPLTPRAAADLARDLANRARDRLHQAEESALRDFIVGRLPSAISTAWIELHDWVDAVNRKMDSASASSGVGVRVKASLRDDLSRTQKVVCRLACRKSVATRTPEEDAQLAEAIKTLLDVAEGETETERVRQAVDVRDWVRIDYFVHRPGQDPKRWTRRTGLSGGERRLVILAPMLASIAALHDNLPDSALRLAALDEVPAEVDERGREGLARYLAELDLDVICTSYLWDGAPGAWDGVDAHDLEESEGVVVAFPMLIRGLDPLPGDPEPGT